MNGIWSVKESESDGMIKFQKLSTVSQQITFSEIMLAAGSSVINDTTMSVAEKIADMAPTRKNVEDIAAYMNDRLTSAFGRADIPKDPPVNFSVGSDGELQISGDRTDMDEINRLFENNPDLEQDMKDFLQFADRMPQYERMLEYKLKYEDALSDAERKALDEEYADLFDGKDHYDVSAVFSGEGMDVNVEYKE